MHLPAPQLKHMGRLNPHRPPHRRHTGAHTNRLPIPSPVVLPHESFTPLPSKALCRFRRYDVAGFAENCPHRRPHGTHTAPHTGATPAPTQTGYPFHHPLFCHMSRSLLCLQRHYVAFEEITSLDLEPHESSTSTAPPTPPRPPPNPSWSHGNSCTWLAGMS